MNLSSHFTLQEMCASQLALRHQIDNVPYQAVIENLKLVCEKILEPVRAEFAIPFSPSSGYRSRALNRRLGSSDKSQHVSGQAVDFELPGISNFDLADWIRVHLDFDQLILEFFKSDDPHSGWVHCSYQTDRERPNRKQALIFDGLDYRPLTTEGR